MSLLACYQQPGPFREEREKVGGVDRMEEGVIGGGNVHSSHSRVFHTDAHLGSTLGSRSGHFKTIGSQCRMGCKFDFQEPDALPTGILTMMSSCMALLPRQSMLPHPLPQNHPGRLVSIRRDSCTLSRFPPPPVSPCSTHFYLTLLTSMCVLTSSSGSVSSSITNEPVST